MWNVLHVAPSVVEIGVPIGDSDAREREEGGRIRSVWCARSTRAPPRCPRGAREKWLPPTWQDARDNAHVVGIVPVCCQTYIPPTFRRL